MNTFRQVLTTLHLRTPPPPNPSTVCKICNIAFPLPINYPLYLFKSCGHQFHPTCLLNQLYHGLVPDRRTANESIAAYLFSVDNLNGDVICPICSGDIVPGMKHTGNGTANPVQGGAEEYEGEFAGEWPTQELRDRLTQRLEELGVVFVAEEEVKETEEGEAAQETAISDTGAGSSK